MTRRALLVAVLDHVVEAEPERAIALCRAHRESAAEHGDSYALALESFALFLAARFEEAAERAAEALRAADPGDPLACATARGAAALADAARPGALETGWRGADGGDPLAAARAALPALGAFADGERGDLAHFARYLVAEAAIASARLLAAEEVLAASGPLVLDFLVEDGRPHDFGVVLGVLRVRVLAFRGRVADAIAQLEIVPVPTGGVTARVRSATEILVRGAAADRARVRALADELDAESPRPSDYLTRGCFLLAAFGLVALGDVRRAARFALTAGGDEAVSRLTTVDRALCLELLVEAATDEGDVDAVLAWAALAEPLLADPIAGSTAHRILARAALVTGDGAAALIAAERALDRARGEGRAIEAAEAEMLAARAQKAAEAGSGARRLLALAASSASTGYLAARRAAVRELRAGGRRPPPVGGSGWGALSSRERDVALLLADGLRNVDIATALHVSEHTVRAHVSRVLTAFGAASRFVVAAEVAALFPDDGPAPTAPLTPQQSAVAARVARGLGNAQIGRELGVSARTVEKHLADIQRRWDAPTRVAVARLVRRLAAAEE